MKVYEVNKVYTVENMPRDRVGEVYGVESELTTDNGDEEMKTTLKVHKVERQ